jgi:heme/copper-type cytochrome/quinol oxidase subunit 2
MAVGRPVMTVVVPVMVAMRVAPVVVMLVALVVFASVIIVTAIAILGKRRRRKRQRGNQQGNGSSLDGVHVQSPFSVSSGSRRVCRDWQTQSSDPCLNAR